MPSGSTSSPGCRSPAPARPTTPRSSPWPSSTVHRRRAPRTARCWPTSPAPSAGPTPPRRTPSSASVVTRCPTSSSRAGSSDRFADGLPTGWHTRPIGELEALAAGEPRGDSASLAAARHDGRPPRAGHPLRGRQPRRPGRPRGRCPPPARARRLQLRALPAVLRRRLAHPPAPRPVRRGPARRAVGAVGRRCRPGARHLRPDDRAVPPRVRQRLGVGRPVAALVPAVAGLDHTGAPLP